MTEITIPVNSTQLQGILEIPKDAKCIILFVHGSGSGRKSPRNQFVAKFLQSQNIATLLFDLLTPEEEKEDLITRKYRFDIALLTKRLIDTTKWLLEQENMRSMKIGYFGASTGAAAAIQAAAFLPNISYVISRGGRPDLAKEALKKIKSATLLIVGGDDPIVIEYNKMALEQMVCDKKIIIIPGATHLFEERGKLEEVAKIAATWLQEQLK